MKLYRHVFAEKGWSPAVLNELTPMQLQAIMGETRKPPSFSDLKSAIAWAAQNKKDPGATITEGA